MFLKIKYDVIACGSQIMNEGISLICYFFLLIVNEYILECGEDLI